MTGGDRSALMRLLTADRACSELRRGRPLLLQAGQKRFFASALETLTDTALAEHRSLTDPCVILTRRRAESLKVRTVGSDPVSIALTERMDHRLLQQLADPTLDLDDPMRGPFTAERAASPPAAPAIVDLCKRARLLPAALLSAVPDHVKIPDEVFAASLDLLRDLDQAATATLHSVASAEVPLLDSVETALHAFRPADGATEHIALLIGRPGFDQPVLVRLHSECFTGDLLGSLRCDCGEQLRGAIRAIAEAGGGILLYMAQEGRGIGLMNKLRAYRLQDQGFDTVDANERLGFEADERLFAPAAAMLRHFGVQSVRLLTNNPAKCAGLEACGIKVVARVPHRFPANPHNAAYLATKRDRSGHQL